MKEKKKPCKAVKKARALIKKGSVSCVIVKDEEIIHTADGRGVSPLITMLDTSPELLKYSLVVDRIIGKAAAMVLVCGGAQAAYGLTMSRAAEGYLLSHGIGAQYDNLIETITNRAGDGVCPLERSVFDIDDANEGLARLRETMAELKTRAMAASSEGK